MESVFKRLDDLEARLHSTENKILELKQVKMLRKITVAGSDRDPFTLNATCKFN